MFKLIKLRLASYGGCISTVTDPWCSFIFFVGLFITMLIGVVCLTPCVRHHTMLYIYIQSKDPGQFQLTNKVTKDTTELLSTKHKFNKYLHLLALAKLDNFHCGCRLQVFVIFVSSTLTSTMMLRFALWFFIALISGPSISSVREGVRRRLFQKSLF